MRRCCARRGRGGRPRSAASGARTMPAPPPRAIFPPMTTRPAPAPADRTLSQVTDARRAAADLCADMRKGEMLDPAFEARAAALDARDRRWLQELVFGMLRRRAELDAQIAPRVTGGLARL